MVWLRGEMDDHDKTLVSMLWCVVCRQYEMSINGLKNFSRAWIDGSSNHKTSKITDYAKSEPHKAAMIRPKAGMSQSLATAPSFIVYYRHQWIQL